MKVLLIVVGVLCIVCSIPLFKWFDDPTMDDLVGIILFPFLLILVFIGVMSLFLGIVY